MDPIDNDALFYAWCDGPGKDYHKKTVMLRDTEVSPLRPVDLWVDGWDKSFYEWVKKGD